MNTFKKWLESTANFNGISTASNAGPETEHDPFIPDQSHIQHAINISKRIKGFFPAFRNVIKTQAILQSFHKNLQNGENPFDYKKSSWLNDEIQQDIADEIGVDINQLEPYCQPLKQYFVQMYNNSKSWNDKQQNQNWPGYNKP